VRTAAAVRILTGVMLIALGWGKVTGDFVKTGFAEEAKTIATLLLLLLLFRWIPERSGVSMGAPKEERRPEGLERGRGDAAVPQTASPTAGGLPPVDGPPRPYDFEVRYARVVGAALVAAPLLCSAARSCYLSCSFTAASKVSNDCFPDSTFVFLPSRA
jgi:hypothetical protein